MLGTPKQSATDAVAVILSIYIQDSKSGGEFGHLGRNCILFRMRVLRGIVMFGGLDV